MSVLFIILFYIVNCHSISFRCCYKLYCLVHKIPLYIDFLLKETRRKWKQRNNGYQFDGALLYFRKKERERDAFTRNRVGRSERQVWELTKKKPQTKNQSRNSSMNWVYFVIPIEMAVAIVIVNVDLFMEQRNVNIRQSTQIYWAC